MLVQRKRALQQNAIFLKQNPDESHLTIDELREMACSDKSSSFMSKLSRYVANITGSSAYWYKIREDLKAIILAKGAPTIFFTFSSADLHWPELHSLFSSNVDSLSVEDRRKNVIDNPHLVDWFFTKRFESFLKHWLYDTMNAEWHWYRYEFQARGSIHCHGTAKLKSDPGLCRLTERALKGFIAEKQKKCPDTCNIPVSVEIDEGQKAAKVICNYVDTLINTWNPFPPESELWTKPLVHPCAKKHKNIPDSERNNDYSDLVNTVQRHTHCSTKYCLRHEPNKEGLYCRFKYPFDCCSETRLEFQQMHTKDKSVQYKASIVTRRNDPRLNNHQKIQLEGWRANCDIQVILDYHACIEYLCKYAAKGEPRSNTLKNTFNSVVHNLNSCRDPLKAMKKIMIKTLGERDFSAQETMHLLLSLKLYSSSFEVLPVNLNGSRFVKTKLKQTDSLCTNDSLLDKYAKRSIFQDEFPHVMKMSFVEFVTMYKTVKNKLIKRSPNVIPRFFPCYSSNPKGINYPLYCKYQLLKYKPWKCSQNDAWDNQEHSDTTFVNSWLNFLNSPFANQHVPDLEKQLQNVLDNVVQQSNELSEKNKSPDQEEWMILSNYHKLNENPHTNNNTPCDWHLDSAKYTTQQIDEMPNWVKVKKSDYTVPSSDNKVDTSTFTEMQQQAYKIIVNHYNNVAPKEPLWLVIIGEGGTGKSFLINAVRNYLKEKCIVTATTGKASFNINGITIHSFLKLPVGKMSQKDLSGQSLDNLQKNLLSVDYIVIDEYSMLGQTTMGWIDKRCRQATGLKDKLFGGKSIILIGDPAQLPPVADKPLYHSKPSNPIAEQGSLAYKMFNNVVILDVNQRIRGSQHDQTLFKGILSRLRIGELSCNDWKLLLARQPTVLSNLNDFIDATRLYYSNDEVAKFNYDHLMQLETPIAEICARHSGSNAKSVSAQEMFGLQPTILICKGAKVMLTMNLWASVGLCNGASGTIVDIIYAKDHHPPDLPIAVLVKFDEYRGPNFCSIPFCVPIPPVTASVNIDNKTLERQQLPLTLAWALTIHKSQGMTLEKAWVDIGKKECTLGITYVALSHARNLTSLVIEPMTYDRLSSIKKMQSLSYRLQEEKRLQVIANLTL